MIHYTIKESNIQNKEKYEAYLELKKILNPLKDHWFKKKDSKTGTLIMNIDIELFRHFHYLHENIPSKLALTEREIRDAFRNSSNNPYFTNRDEMIEKALELYRKLI